MAQQNMRQFIQPDFQSQPEPILDWMPWDQAPTQQEGGGIGGMLKRTQDGEGAEGAAKASVSPAIAAASKGLGAASL